MLPEYLPSVLASTYQNYKVYVIDNASTDDSIQILKPFFTSIELIQLDENHGFTGGYNRGLKQIKADLYILLNSDVKVNPDWLEPLVDTMSDPSVGACQPKVLSHNRPTEFEYAGACGGHIDYLGFTFCRGRLFDVVEEDKGQYDEVQDISWATGAAMCIRANLYHKLGGLDESFFAHFEEIDLCWRLRRAGYRLVCNPSSIVYHLGGGTLAYQSSNKTFLNYRNNLSTIVKNESWLKLLWLFPTRIALEAVSAYEYLFEGNLPFFWAIVKAHFSVFRRLGKLFKQRRIDKKCISLIRAKNPVASNSVVHRRSIIFDYFLRGKKKYSDL